MRQELQMVSRLMDRDTLRDVMSHNRGVSPEMI